MPGMWAVIIISTLISIGSAIAAYALTPKPPQKKPPGLEDLNFPTAEAGHPIPVVFGTVLVKCPNVVWYGDLHYTPIKS
jgi:hypothetical protein